MKINVKYIAQLSRLELTEKEALKFQKQFEDILTYVKRLEGLKTEKIVPLSHATSSLNVFRKDEVRPSLKTDEALENAPHKENNFFKVPKVIK